MVKNISILVRSWARDHLPQWLLRLRRWVNSRILYKYQYGYRYKQRRTGPLDYTTEFDHRDIRKAQGSILWYAAWDEYTAANLEILRNLDLVHENTTILDYGCGIGRISRELIKRYPCHVIAVDRSYWMRKHFRNYFSKKDATREALSSEQVRLWSDEEFIYNVTSIESKVDLVLFIETLQHIPEPILDELLPQVVRTLHVEGKLFVLGNQFLDVDLSGSAERTPIATYLRKHSHILRIIREDIYEGIQGGDHYYTFKSPRYSFVCSRVH